MPPGAEAAGRRPVAGCGIIPACYDITSHASRRLLPRVGLARHTQAPLTPGDPAPSPPRDSGHRRVVSVGGHWPRWPQRWCWPLPAWAGPATATSPAGSPPPGAGRWAASTGGAQNILIMGLDSRLDQHGRALPEDMTTRCTPGTKPPAATLPCYRAPHPRRRRTSHRDLGSPR